MKWNINDVPIFVATVDQKGISAAANFLHMPKSTVSRSISRLEEGLGIRLLERNSRRLRITSEGEAFYRHAVLIMEQVETANVQMVGLTSVPSGRLTVALPMAFSREIIGGKLAEFNRRYPLINLEVIVTSHSVDIIRDQIDIALVVGSLNDSELIAQQLLETSLIWITSPSYIHENKLDGSIDNILKHVRVCEKRYGSSRLVLRDDSNKQTIDLTSVVHVNDALMVREMVMEGAGVSLAPMIYCRRLIAEGHLLQIWPHIRIESTANVSVVYPSRRLLSNKSRAFIEYIKEITTQF